MDVEMSRCFLRTVVSVETADEKKISLKIYGLKIYLYTFTRSGLKVLSSEEINRD
jgi:hypothetical protein